MRKQNTQYALGNYNILVGFERGMSEGIYVGEVAPPPGDGADETPQKGQGHDGPGENDNESRANADDLAALMGAGLDEMLAGIVARQEPAPEFAEYVKRRPPALLV